MESDIKTLLSKLAEKIKIKYPQYKVNIREYTEGVPIVISISHTIDKKWVRDIINFYIDGEKLVLEYPYDPFHINKSYLLYEPDSLDKFFCDLDKYLRKSKKIL